VIGELKDVEPVTDLGYRVERHRYCSEKLIETADRVLDHYGNDEASALLAFAVRQILFDVAQAELALSVALLESAVEKAS
jgi:hypothetical protein